MSDDYSWDQLKLEVLKAASKKISLRDFDILCQLSPPTAGMSYYDRLRVAENLISEGLVVKEDGFLRISLKHLPSWLITGLENGAQVSWDILQTIDFNQKFENKVDRLLLERIGIEGELQVIKWLNETLDKNIVHKINHVSLTDDSAGFDIVSPSIRNSDDALLLEVKTCSKPGKNFNFFISRNESRIASLNDNWRLIGVVRRPNGYELLGSLRYSVFVDLLPVDTSANGRWESAKITIPIDFFEYGLP